MAQATQAGMPTDYASRSAARRILSRIMKRALLLVLVALAPLVFVGGAGEIGRAHV